MERRGSRPINELIRLAIIGDAAAFTELWDTNINSLKAYIRSGMKHLDDFYVDDICSRSFEKAFRQINSYDPSKSLFLTWLKVIAHNTALDVIGHENRTAANCIYLDDASGTLSVENSISDDIASPLDSIIRDEDEAMTMKYIDSLPELYREVARKRLIDGMQYKEIADAMKLELNTVRTRIRRAKAIIEKLQNSEQ